MPMRKAFYVTVLATLLFVGGLFASGHIFSSYGAIAVLTAAVGVAICCSRRSAVMPGWQLATVLSLVAGFVFWYTSPSIGVYPTITLSVTGDKHPEAKSAEIWLSGIGYPSGQFSTKGFEGWAKRDSAIVGYMDTAKTIQVPKTWREGAVLRMGRGPYSGIVEVEVDGQRSRIDLYSSIPAAHDFVLPHPSNSVFSTPWRALSTLLFAWAVFLICACCASGTDTFRSSVTLIAVVVGTCVWLGFSSPSAPGDIEFLAVGVPPPAEGDIPPAKVFLGTAHGKVDRLPLQYPAYRDGAFRQLPGVSSLDLQVDSPPLAIWTKAGRDTPSELSCNKDNPLVVELDPSRASELQAKGEGVSAQFSVRPEVSDSTGAGNGRRLFAVCWPYEGGLMVGWSSAYFRYSAWSAPVHAVERVYVTASSAPALMLRLSSTTRRYLPMEIIQAGEFTYPKLSAPWNHAELARRFVTALIAGLCILLAIPITRIGKMVGDNVKAGKGAAVSCLLAVTGVWMVATIAISWPGIIGWDALSPVIQHGAGGVSLWYGVGYPLLTSAFLNLGGPEFSLLMKVLLLGVTILWVALEALNEGARAWLVNAYVVGMLVFTGTTMVVATELRDAVNSVALSGFGLLCVVLLIDLRHRRMQLSSWHYAMIVILGAGLVLLRTDNIVYVGVLLLGFAFVRPWRRNLVLCVAIALVWLAATPLTIRYVLAGGDHGRAEMRLYTVSAFVNPLVGMLRGDALSSEERVALGDTLEKVLKVDFSVEHWTPSDVIYWHQSDKGHPSVATLAELRRTFVVYALRHPIEFFTLRTATFVKALGMDSAAAWIAKGHIDRPFSLPPYFDHLAGNDAHWRSMVALAGYQPPEHLSPDLTAKMYAWYERIALGIPQLLFALLVAVGFRRHPATSLLAAALLGRAALFWLMQPASVFLYLGELQVLGTLLPLLAWSEWRQRARNH